MRKYIYLLVMLVLGTMLTACYDDWWEGKKYGNDLTLDNITVKGNVVFVELPSGQSETLYLDSVKAEKAEIVINDTIGKVWNDIDFSEIRCEGTHVTYRQTKEQKGNLKLYNSICYTTLKFEKYAVPIGFTHDLVGVTDKMGKDTWSKVAYQYRPVVDYADLHQENLSDKYGQICCHLLVDVSENRIPIGTIDVILKVYVRIM